MKLRIQIIILLASLAISGCGVSGKMADIDSANETIEDTQTLVSDKKAKQDINLEELRNIKSEDIAESYREIYQKASAEGSLESLETVKSIVNFLGKNGYTAIDNENQVDMVNPERAKAFAKSVENKEPADLTMICVMSGGGFIRYDLLTLDGNVDVTVSSLLWNNKVPVVNYQEQYPANFWSYTENGYMFFDQYHMPGICWGHTAIRVEPLDETCRELNRKYIRPITYSRNNMFITDWNESDFGELDFYDLFDLMYPMKFETFVPYIATDDGLTYQIPQAEFEEVLMSYLRVKSSAIQSKASFDSKTGIYSYRPRGTYDNGQGEEFPYPEVISYQENEDGTLTLTVNGVLPAAYLDNAFTHEVVVRPLENGSFQYVSNHVVQWQDEVSQEWYLRRMTEEEWQEFYQRPAQVAE